MTRPQIFLAVGVAVYLLALRGCYDIVPGSGSPTGSQVFRLNRLTGSVADCTYAGCTPLTEDSAKKAQP